jgi:PHS family inorganic phosphate transporter-like MFS transporter
MATSARSAFDVDREITISRRLLQQLDEQRTTTGHWKILVTSAMGFFTDAYDLFVIGVVASIITKQWHIASYEKSLLSSLALLTSAIGAVFFGRIADRLGRKKIYGYEVLVLAAGAIASAFAPSIWWLIAFRAVLGFGIGGDYPVSATIMSEYASRNDRGRMVSLVFAAQGFGLIVGPALAIALLESGMPQGYVWRVLLGAGAIPGLAVFVLRRRIRETPRFELARLEAEGADRRARELGLPTGLRGVLADRRVLRWLIGCTLAWLTFDFAYYGNTISGPIILKLVAPHGSLVTTTTYTLIIFAVAAFPAYFLAAYTIDRIGRRFLQTTGFFVMAIAFFCLWAVPGATSTVSVFLVLFGATYWFAEFGPNTTTFVYPAEIFPVRVRTTSHGIAAAGGKVGGFIGTYALTTVLPVIGLPRTSVIVAGAAVIGGMTSWLLLPEPRRKSLEDLTEHGARFPTSAVTLGLAESRGLRPPAA